MKVNELINFVEENRAKILKAEQLQKLLEKTLEIKKYISIKDKRQIIDNIVNSCILWENNIFKFNDIDKYILFTMKTIEAYTNLELSVDIEEDYDMLCRTGILELIISAFKKEYDDISVLLQMQCDYILSNNSIEAQIGKFLTDLSEKIDGISNVMSDKISNFDVHNLPIEKEDLEKLMKFVNM